MLSMVNHYGSRTYKKSMNISREELIGVCSYGLSDCKNWAPEVYTKVNCLSRKSWSILYSKNMQYFTMFYCCFFLIIFVKFTIYCMIYGFLQRQQSGYEVIKVMTMDANRKVTSDPHYRRQGELSKRIFSSLSLGSSGRDLISDFV